MKRYLHDFQIENLVFNQSNNDEQVQLLTSDVYLQQSTLVIESAPNLSPAAQALTPSIGPRLGALQTLNAKRPTYAQISCPSLGPRSSINFQQ